MGLSGRIVASLEMVEIQLEERMSVLELLSSYMVPRELEVEDRLPSGEFWLLCCRQCVEGLLGFLVAVQTLVMPVEGVVNDAKSEMKNTKTASSFREFPVDFQGG